MENKATLTSNRVETKKKIKNKAIKVFKWLFYNILYDILKDVFEKYVLKFLIDNNDILKKVLKFLIDNIFN